MHRIRRAVEADQRAITAMVRDARLNPRSLDWHRFVVAEADGELVGVAQMRQHADGSRELASLVVRPSARGRGVAGDLIDEQLADQAGQVFMLVAADSPPIMSAGASARSHRPASPAASGGSTGSGRS